MKQKIILAILRHALTALGGAIAAGGYISTSDAELATGALMTLIAVIWSVIEKHQR